jgi:hypothetical protein
MGWDFCDSWTTPADIHREILGGRFFSPEYKVIDHKATSFGRHFWAVLEKTTGERTIFLALIEKHDGRCGYKGMDEQCGPSYYDCPLEFLAKVPEPSHGYAVEWRGKVRAFHEASKKEWKRGDECMIHGKKYTVVASQKRSWLVRGQDGQVYCASPKHMHPA